MSDSLGSQFVGGLNSVLKTAGETFATIFPIFTTKDDVQREYELQLQTGQRVAEVEAERSKYQIIAVGATIFLALLAIGFIKMRG